MPELRKDPVIGQWVIIASERRKRPRDFGAMGRNPVFDQAVCPFCPGKEDHTPPEIYGYRSNSSEPDTPGWSIRVIPNKFPALQREGILHRETGGLYHKMGGIGAHEVIIETPDHMLTVSNMTEEKLKDVLLCYKDRIQVLRKDKRFQYILIFKNEGEVAGASLAHPHSQLIALPIVPSNVIEKIQGARRYYKDNNRCVYCDIVRNEVEFRNRLITENDHYVGIAPYASRFPFESLILSKNHHAHFEDSGDEEIESLSRILREVLRRLDKALDRAAYNFLVHSLPFNTMKWRRDGVSYHWHLEIVPRLIHVAGFEWGSGIYINPTPPEEAARILQETEVES